MTRSSIMSAAGSGLYTAIDSTRLMRQWLRKVNMDPTLDWHRNADLLGQMADRLVENDPHAAALENAMVEGVLGADGLRFRCLYQADDDEAVSDAELAVRRQVDRAVQRAYGSQDLHAGQQMFGVDLDEQGLRSEARYGDQIWIRTYKPRRTGARFGNCWRILHPRRVCDPADRHFESSQISGVINGFQFRDGVWVGIWVQGMDSVTGQGTGKWEYVPRWSNAGMPNVLHRARLRRPGEVRGISWYAPLLVLATHLSSSVESYAVAKRTQASYTGAVRTDNPHALAAAQLAGTNLSDAIGPMVKPEPGTFLFLSHDDALEFPSIQFNGADLEQYIDSMLRAFTAAWGLPFQVVMAQLTKTNMAASRAALLQWYRTNERYQNSQIRAVVHPRNRVVIREAMATGMITVPGATLDDLAEGRYQRPPRTTPDPAREAQAARAWLEMGKDPSDMFADMGWDFADDVMGAEQSVRFAARHGITLPVGSSPDIDEPAAEDNDNEVLDET